MHEGSGSRRLHIGGWQRCAGWEILDAQPGAHVDHVGDASDLSHFADASFEALYASHVLEHFDFRDELVPVLHGWRRVLRPGGTLYISVPDLERLCQIYVAPERTPAERFRIMTMIFGSHVDHYDYHMAGLDEHYLAGCLAQAGFAGARRVERFGLFADTSILEVYGMQISLNMIAERPQQP